MEYEQMTPEQKEKYRQIMETNIRTYRHFAPVWERNMGRNLLYTRGKLSFRNIGEHIDHNKVALVCGAGPSLARHLPLIKVIAPVCTIFCAEAAFPILYDNGVIPDFVVSMDAQPGAFARPLSHAKEKIKSILLFPVTSDPEAYAKWRGKVMYYRLCDPANPSFVKSQSLFPNVPDVLSRLHVGELCVQLAAWELYYEYVAFTGIDLAIDGANYYSQGVTHLPHEVEKLHGNQLDLKEIVNVQMPDGTYRSTTPLFAQFVESFMQNYQHFYKPKTQRIFNLSCGIIPLPYDLYDFATFLNDRYKLNIKFQQEQKEAVGYVIQTENH